MEQKSKITNETNTLSGFNNSKHHNEESTYNCIYKKLLIDED